MKAKVLEKFRDKNTGQLYEVGAVIEISQERFEEIQATAETYNSSFLEQVKEKPKTSPRRGKKPQAEQ